MPDRKNFHGSRVLREAGAVRSTLGNQLASALAGGLLRLSHDQPWSVALYLVASSLLTLGSVYLASETSTSDLA